MQFASRNALLRCTLYLAVMMTAAAFFWRMPGRSFRGTPPALTANEAAVQTVVQRHVRVLAGEIGERNAICSTALRQAADYIVSNFTDMGYAPVRMPYTIGAMAFDNIVAEHRGVTHPKHILVVGAHYDSVVGTPGADDNATGVAGLIALAQSCARRRFSQTIRFVAFVNEEPPFYHTSDMGSLVYARACRARGETLRAMLCLEMLGYYSNASHSQLFPEGLGWLLGRLVPRQGNFIAFTGNVRSIRLLRRCMRTFRRTATVPSEGAVLPESLSGLSDNWSFWQIGVPALMVTDTAMFRNPHYHGADDTIATLDFESMTRVIIGLDAVIDELAGVVASDVDVEPL